MLSIRVPAGELWDEANNQFINSPETTLLLEHSLVSLSKWEVKHEKPFLSDASKSNEETIDYIMCMTLTPDVDPNVYGFLSPGNFNDVNEYINAKSTATWFVEKPGAPGSAKGTSREAVTSELIYYWMIALTIPVEFQDWHLNRLLTLIKVCNLKNQPEKKQGRVGKMELAQQRRQLNEQRRAQAGTSG